MDVFMISFYTRYNQFWGIMPLTTVEMHLLKTIFVIDS